MQIAWKRFVFVTDPWIIEALYKKNNKFGNGLVKSHESYELLGEIFHPLVFTPSYDLHEEIYAVYLKQFMHQKELKGIISVIRNQVENVLDKFGDSKVNITSKAAEFICSVILKGVFGEETDHEATLSVIRGLEGMETLVEKKFANPFHPVTEEASQLKKSILSAAGLENWWERPETTPILRGIQKILGSYVDSEEQKKCFESFVVGVLFGTMETSMIALPYLLNHLGDHQDWQQKLELERREKIKDFSNDKSLFKYLNDKNTLLHRIFLESLRLNPPFLANGRCAAEDIVITDRSGESYEVSKDTSIMLMHFYAGRDNRYWGEDVASFNPDRFLSEEVNAVPFPLLFGQNQTACPGRRVFEFEAKIFILEMVRRYTWSSCESLKDMGYRAIFTFRPADDLHIQLHQREKED